MPVEFPQYGGQGDPRPVLKQYIIAVQKFLGEIVETGTDYHQRPLFIRELFLPMQRAWSEIPPHFERVVKSIAELDDERIDRHGLKGAQLSFKLQAVSRRNRTFVVRGGVTAFHRIIKSIDTLLESILSATSAGTAISEIKDYIDDATAR